MAASKHFNIDQHSERVPARWAHLCALFNGTSRPKSTLAIVCRYISVHSEVFAFTETVFGGDCLCVDSVFLHSVHDLFHSVRKNLVTKLAFRTKQKNQLADSSAIWRFQLNQIK